MPSLLRKFEEEEKRNSFVIITAEILKITYRWAFEYCVGQQGAFEKVENHSSKYNKTDNNVLLKTGTINVHMCHGWYVCQKCVD